MLNGKNIFAASLGELKNTRSLTFAGVLTGFYAVSYLVILKLIPGIIEIRFGFLVIAVAGMMLGPATATLVALLGDILGAALFSGSPFFWGFTLSWALQGLLFGLFFYKKAPSLPRVLAVMLINLVCINMLLTTLWIHMMGSGVFWELLVARLPTVLAMFPVNTILLTVVLRACSVALRRLEQSAAH